MTAMPTADWEPTYPSAEPPMPDSLPPQSNSAPPNQQQFNIGGTVPAPSPVPADDIAAAKEAAAAASQAQPAPPSEDVVEVIMPSADPREQEIRNTSGEVVRVYVQKPLSYFRKMQFFKILAKGLRTALDDGGMEAVSEIFGITPGQGASVQDAVGKLTQADYDGAAGFLQIVLSVFEQSEDLLEDAYVVWLAVPPVERDWAKKALRGDFEDLEPLSDEDGWAIMKTFVVQNWEAMQAFFTVHAKEVFEVARTEQRRIADAG